MTIGKVRKRSTHRQILTMFEITPPGRLRMTIGSTSDPHAIAPATPNPALKTAQHENAPATAYGHCSGWAIAPCVSAARVLRGLARDIWVSKRGMHEKGGDT